MEKNWWKNNYVDRRIYLLENYKNYSFTPAEYLLIMEIELMNSTGTTITMRKLEDTLRMSERDINNILGKLVGEGWIYMELTSKNLVIKLDAIYENKPKKEVSQSLFDLFDAQFKRTFNSSEYEMLARWMQEYDEDMIRRALREAVVYNKLSFKYINTILEQWKAKDEKEQALKGENA